MGQPMQMNSAFHPVGRPQPGPSVVSQPISTQQIRPFLPPSSTSFQLPPSNILQPDWLTQGYTPNPIPDMTAIRERLNALTQLPDSFNQQNNTLNSAPSSGPQIVYTTTHRQSPDHHAVNQNVSLFNKDPHITVHEPTFVLEEQQTSRVNRNVTSHHFIPLSQDDSLLSESDFKSKSFI